MKNMCSNISRESETQATEQGKIFATGGSNKGLVSRMHKSMRADNSIWEKKGLRDYEMVNMMGKGAQPH